LVEYIVNEKPSPARLGHLQGWLIQVASVYRDSEIALEHLAGDAIPAANFQRLLQRGTRTLNRSDDQMVSPLHPKMICRRELKPLVRH
jgi:hypothetical protein